MKTFVTKMVNLKFLNIKILIKSEITRINILLIS